MPQANIVGNPYHAATKHSFRSVQADPNFVDSSTQPCTFKRYPQFFRRFPLQLELPLHAFIQTTSAITFQKMYREGPYALRVNPSAGALYPTEIYVQLRGIPSLLDGIYHLEIETSSLTLIYELIDDGLEAYLLDQTMVHGCIFLVSCVYFRSSWKYKNRSLRYCLLDSGHHVGAIEASAYAHSQPLQILFDFDKLAINHDMGFENKEFATTVVLAGEFQSRNIRRLRSPIPFVSGTDYFEPNHFIEAAYQSTLTQTVQSPSTILSHCNQKSSILNSTHLLNIIQERRSARRFQAIPISGFDFQTILSTLAAPVPAAIPEIPEVYCVVHAVEGWTSGIYRRDQCVQSGDFRERTGYLCISQAIARDSAVTFFFVAKDQPYQTALQLAGFLGQRLYLAATALGLGCSGIGAFYDDETQTFLKTEGDVVYAVAIGCPYPTHQTNASKRIPQQALTL